MLAHWPWSLAPLHFTFYHCLRSLGHDTGFASTLFFLCCVLSVLCGVLLPFKGDHATFVISVSFRNSERQYLRNVQKIDYADRTVS